MADVVLINPPSYADVPQTMILPNLGLAYLASTLEKDGIDVKIIDAWYTNMSREEIIKELGRLDPKIVGFYSASEQLRETVFLANEIKRRLNSFTVLGGPHISSDPKFIYSYKNLDMGFVGEGEVTFPKVVKSILKNEKQKKIVYGKFPKDLDSLPFPAYDLISLNKNSLVTTRKKCSHVIISRGCPYNCIFCSIEGNPIRFRSADNITEEISLLVNEHGIESILFECTSFTLNKRQVLDLCKNLRREHIDISWSCATRCNLIDEEMIREMNRAGCYNINFGVESGSYQIRKMVGKDFTDSTIIKVFNLCRKYKISTGSYWMLGFPYETTQTIKKTIDFSIKLNSDFASYLPVFIYPGTKIFELAVKNDIIERDVWNRFIEGYPVPIYLPSNLTKKDILNFCKIAYRKFYLRPSKIPVLKKINFFADITHLKRLLITGKI